jgi:hypothetical protein
MSRFTVTFDTDNDAFAAAVSNDPLELSPRVQEFDRIFGRISDSVWEGNVEGRIRDSNGNTIGSWEWVQS